MGDHFFHGSSDVVGSGEFNNNMAEYYIHLQGFFPVGLGSPNAFKIEYRTYFENTDAQVPEPTTLFLFGPGLFGLVGYSRRRR